MPASPTPHVLCAQTVSLNLTPRPVSGRWRASGLGNLLPEMACLLALAAVCALWAPLAATAQTPLHFASSLAYLPGNGVFPENPIAVVTGKFTDSTLEDFAVVEQSAGTESDWVDIFLAQPAGGFKLDQIISLGAKVSNNAASGIANHILVTGHFHSPTGRVDLAVATTTGFVVLVNTSSVGYGFVPLVVTASPAAPSTSIAAGNFNGGQLDDIAVAIGNATGSIGVYLNPGTGTGEFQATPTTTLIITKSGSAKTVNGSILLAGTFAEGSSTHANLALLTGSTVNVYRNTGGAAGSFKPPISIAMNVPPFFPVNDLTTGDVLHDGNVDLVALTSSGAQYLEEDLLNPLIGPTLLSDVSGTVLAVGDLDSTGYADFVVGPAPTIFYDPGEAHPPFPAQSATLAPVAQSIAIGLGGTGQANFIVSVGESQNHTAGAPPTPAGAERSIVVTTLNASAQATAEAPSYPFGGNVDVWAPSPVNVTTQMLASDPNLLGSGVPGVAVLGYDTNTFIFTVNPYEYTSNGSGLQSTGVVELDPNNYYGVPGGAITSGHFRGQGALPDLALTVNDYDPSGGHGGSPGIIILQNNAGAFSLLGTASTFTTMGEMGSTLLATDLDKTGYDGLVVLTPGGCGKQGTASVFLSASTATLQTDALNGPYPVNLPSEFLNPISVAAGNFTGGPYEDLVIADAGSGSPCTPYTPPSVWLFKNTTTAPGTQTFSALEEIWTPPSTIPSTQSAQVSQVLTYPYSAGRNPYLLISAFDGVHVMENVGGSPNPFKEEAVLSLYEDDPNFSYAWQLALGNFSGTSTNEVAVASNDFVYIYPLNQTTGALLPTPNYAGAAVSMPLTGTYGGYANQIVPLQRFGHLDDLMVAGESGFAALLNSGTYTPALPVVTTKVASAVSSSGGTAKATLNGLVKANNTTSQYYWFVYGTSPLAMNTSTPMVGPVTGPSATTAKATVTTLVPNTDYFFQLWASDAAGKSKGAVQSFVTPASAPTVTTDPATGVSLAGAILNGTVTANNSTTDYWFAYGTSKTALTSLTTKTPGFSGIKANPVTFALSGLKSNTTYYFQVVAANSAGTSKGSVLSFKTY